MLGVSGMLGTVSTDGSATAARVAEAQESGGTSGGSGGTGIPVGGFSEEDKARLDEEGGGAGGGGGNRWPRQETMALLKIRSDMDVIFRDSSLKGPLWEQVSRKMAELGYHRNAKKCKEKFENVYKYHKRTKEGRSTKPDGKNYRFFEALEALEHISSSQFPPQPPPPPQPRPQAQVQSPTMATPLQAIHPPPMVAQITVSSTPPASSTPVSVAQNTTPSTTPQSFNNFINSSFPPSQPILQQQPPLPPPPPLANPIVPPPSLHQTISGSFLSNSMSSSSSTSSDEDIERRHKRKRKWKDYFDKLMKDVVDKQEELQKKFLESLEKRERDRMIREEAWRVQEMARINREHDLLVQERSITAARESALISFLQKMSDQQNPNPTPHPPPPPPSQPQISVHLPEPPMQRPTPPAPAPAPPQISTPPPVTTNPAPVTTPAPISSPTPFSTPPPTLALVPVPPPRSDNGGDTFMGTTSSRWPKAEVEALIKLRTSLDNKYQENGPKGPLWEDISAGMRKIGYNRNAKRCKEKWENINKYFKKVKESNKRRPEDSKTCPYFHQLEALYKEKAKTDPSPYNPNLMAPIMARPEQQWPLPPVQQQQLHHHNSAMDEHEGDNIDDHDDDDDDDDDGDDDEDDEGSGYEIVTNKTSSVATTVG